MLFASLQSFLSRIFYLASNWPMATACLTLVGVGLIAQKTLAWTRDKTEERHLPPGPRGVPLLGYIPFIRKPWHVVFKELSDQYGPIVRIRLGCKDVVVLNDLPSIREGLTNPDVLFRPDNFPFRCFGVEGIGSLNGEPWQENRRYCFHVLRNLGFAKKSMERHIQEEVQCFTELLASGKGQPSLVAQPLAVSFANNITALVFGQRYDLSHPRARLIEHLLGKLLRHANFLSFEDFLPPIRLLAAHIPNSRRRIMNYVFKEFTVLVRSEVKEREGNMERYSDRDFIDGYLRKIEENQGTDSHYCLGYLQGITINFYSASTNTVRSAVLWNLYIMASSPDGLQARVQREIDAAVGRHKLPDWKDRRRMPFTMACILEQQRWRTAAPTSIQRATGRDTVIGGYRVPAGTLVIPNLWNLHNDPRYWQNPSQYDPTRFLNSDGTEVDEKPQAFLPFSVGRRACPGETLALMAIFLYVTGALQRFRVLPEEGVTLSLDAEDALLLVANDKQKLRFILR